MTGTGDCRLQRLERVGGAGVARDHHGLHPLLQQPVAGSRGCSAHGLGRLGAVRHPGGIAEVDRGLVGEALVDRAGHGEAADAGVEDADRGAVHRMRNGMDTAGADAARHRLDPEVAGKIREVGRDVGLEPGEQVIECEQHQPVLVLLPLVLGRGRSRCAGGSAARRRVLRLIAERDALPGDEDARRQLPVEPGLTPARDEERAPERVEGLMRSASESATRAGCGGRGRRIRARATTAGSLSGSAAGPRPGAARARVMSAAPIRCDGGEVAGACGNRTHRSRRRRLHRGFEDRPDHQARSAPVSRGQVTTVSR